MGVIVSLRSTTLSEPIFDLVPTEFSGDGPAASNRYFKVMCTENFQERKELIYALHKDRKLSELPKITQPTLIIWGEHDQVFPLELAHRLERHLEQNAQLVVLKKAGHAINLEKTKEIYRCMKSFLNSADSPNHSSNGHNGKID